MNLVYKKFFLAILATLILYPAWAQRSEGTRSSGLTLPKTSSYYYYDDIPRPSLNVHYAYRIPSFVNKNYATHLEKGDIKRLYSHEVGIGIHVFDPFYIDLSVFKDGFSVKNDPSFEGRTVKNLGGEAFLTVEVLPNISYVSTWLHPYVGIGYTFGGLQAKNSQSSDDNYGAALNSFMFKGGIRLLFSRFFLMGEYKQTLPLSSGRLMSVISIGGGISY